MNNTLSFLGFNFSWYDHSRDIAHNEVHQDLRKISTMNLWNTNQVFILLLYTNANGKLSGYYRKNHTLWEGIDGNFLDAIQGTCQDTVSASILKFRGSVFCIEASLADNSNLNLDCYSPNCQMNSLSEPSFSNCSWLASFRKCRYTI